VTFFVTAICNVISVIIAFLFSRAAVILAQKWIAHKHTTTSSIAFFASLKHHRAPPLSLRKWGKTQLFLVALFYSHIFTYVTPGLAVLLTPIVFNRKVAVTGTELDFGSVDTTCIDWFNNNTIPHQCDWQTYKGEDTIEYTNCLDENQLVDVLESGRGNILSLLSNNTVSLTYTQLGGGLHFLGSMRGVLATGPNGVFGFNTLSTNSFADAATAPELFYNYTLELQGVANNVTCAYDTISPITYSAVFSAAPSSLWSYNGSCPSGQDVLPPSTVFTVPSSNNSLGYWACGSSGSYTVYLTGRKEYAAGIGNITCTVAPYQPALFGLQYTGQSSLFSFTTKEPISTATTSTELVDRTFLALGANIQEAQSYQANAVAESVITFGVKSFNQMPYKQNDTYLRLYEAMIRGVFDYEATYIRLIYSAVGSSGGQAPAPPSCMRVINGSANYEVYGWFASRHVAAYLVPATLINLTTLVILFIAACIADEDGTKRLPSFDPTNPVKLVQSSAPSAGDSPTDHVLALGRNMNGEYGVWPKHKVVSSAV